MLWDAKIIKPLLLFAAVCSAALSITVEDNGKGFTVSTKSGGRRLLEHTRKSPIFFVGSGDVAFREESGSFFIDNKVFSRVPLYDYSISQSGENYTITLSMASLKAKLLMTPRLNGIEIIVKDVTDGLDHFWFRVKADAQEQVFGAGSQLSLLNLRQREKYVQNIFPIWVREQGVGRDKRTLTTFMADTRGGDSGGDYYTTYYCHPTFVSSNNYFFHHEGNNYAILDFSDDEFHEIFVYGAPGQYIISESDSLLNTVGSLSKFLGHMPNLPDWIQEKGIISVQGGTEHLKQKFDIAVKHNVPFSAIWIQDWSGQYKTAFGTRVNWNWQWDPTLYKDLDRLIGEWKKVGVRILGYINPNLMVNGTLFKEAAGKGYLVMNQKGGIYIRRSITLLFGQVDLTNPAAFEWYKNVIKKNMIDLGLGGWMADFGEYLATDAVLYGGRKGQDMHNEFPVLWAKCNREAIEEAGKFGDVVFFTRSGFSGSSKYSTLLWNGDQNVDFSLADGVRSTIYGSLGAGMNGITFSHFDIGGYTTSAELGMVRSKELLLRSAEYAAFTSVFRTHEGNQIEANVQWYDEGVTDEFAVHAKAFADIADYRKAVGKESVTHGWPTMRVTSLVFPNNSDPVPFDQYMFGTDLLVAPVYLQGAINRSVTFPELPSKVQWQHIYTGTNETGGQTKVVDAPLGRPPVYFRTDSKYVSTFSRLKIPGDSDAMVG